MSGVDGRCGGNCGSVGSRCVGSGRPRTGGLDEASGRCGEGRHGQPVRHRRWSVLCWRPPEMDEARWAAAGGGERG
jgi:hypothetical protein